MLGGKKTLFVDVLQELKDDYTIRIRSYSGISLYYGTVRDLYMKHSLLKSVICDAEVLKYEIRSHGFYNWEATIDINATPGAIIAEMDENKEIVSYVEKIIDQKNNNVLMGASPKGPYLYPDPHLSIRERWNLKEMINKFYDSFLSSPPKIKNIIFNGPATIVFWEDGSKTVVKCDKKDIYDPEKGVLWAIVKKYTENQPNAYGDYLLIFDHLSDYALKEILDLDKMEVKNARKTTKRTKNSKSSKSH